MKRPLDKMKLVALYIDGIGFGGHLIAATIGLDIYGKKHILGIWEGSTENATLCKDLLGNLVQRGLKTDQGLLGIIDGSKALSSAIKEVFGANVLIQRCQIHKKRNILDYLPEKEKEKTGSIINDAFNDKRRNKHRLYVERRDSALHAGKR